MRTTTRVALAGALLLGGFSVVPASAHAAGDYDLELYPVFPSPAAVEAGGTTTLTGVVINHGSADTSGPATVTFDLPADLAFVSGSGCAAAGGTVTCTTGGVVPAQSNQAVDVVVRLDAGATGISGPVAASVSGPDLDPDGSNNSVTTYVGLLTDPSSSANLYVTADLPSPWTQGSSKTLTLTVHNDGPDAAVDVVLVPTVGGGIVITGWPAECTAPFCPVGTLPAASSASFDLSVDLLAGYDIASVWDFVLSGTAGTNSNGSSSGFPLEPPGPTLASFDGSVTDSADVGIEGAWVTLTNVDTYGSYSDVTGAGGAFSFTDLPAGSYAVQAYAAGYLGEYYDNADQLTDATVILIAEGEAVSGYQLRLGQGSRIQGAVTAGGVGVAGANVQLYRWPSGWSVWPPEGGLYSGTPVGGAFDFGGLTAGTYTLGYSRQGEPLTYLGGVTDIASATPIILGDDEIAGPFDLPLPQLGSISGRVQGPGNVDLGGFQVQASAIVGWNFISRTTLTNPDGTYTISDLPIASYQVGAYPPPDVPSDLVGENWTSTGGVYGIDGEPVPVGDGEAVAGINFDLEVGGRISGRVTGPNGEPLVGMGVSVQGASGTYGGFATTDNDGRYTARGLAPLPDTVVFVNGIEPYRSAYAPGTEDLGSASQYAIGLGDVVTGVDVVLPRGGLSALFDLATSPAPSFSAVQVCAGDTTLSVGGGFPPAILCGGAVPPIAGVGLNPLPGMLNDLAPGTYTTAVYSYFGGGLGPSTTFTIADPEQVVSCQLGLPGEASSSCAASLTGAISGRVTAPNAQLIPEPVQVLAYDPSTGGVIARSVADGLGYYTLDRVLPGDVAVKFAPLNNSPYAAEFYDNAADLAGATPVTVVAGQTTTGVNAVLSTAIDGLVRFLNDDGTPFDATGIFATGPIVCPPPASGLQITCADGSTYRNFVAEPGEVGVWRVGPMSPGTYDVVPIVSLSQAGLKATFTVNDGQTFDCTMYIGSNTPFCTIIDIGGPPDDNDGVDPGVEDGGPNNGDGNDDGTPDSQQANVTSLPIASPDPMAPPDTQYLTIETKPELKLATVTVDPVDTYAGAPAAAVDEIGAIGFEVSDPTWVPADGPLETDVVIYLPPGVTPTGYAKYLNGAWVDASAYADLSVPGQITLHLIDGNALLDEDGVVNGVIKDPGVPLFDTTAPVVECPSAPNVVLHDPSATLTATVADEAFGSGVASSMVSVALATHTIGSQSVVVSASDLAGNVGTASCDYTVGVKFGGFLSPITPGAVNVVKAGRTVPVKWRVLDALGNPVSDPASFQRLYSYAYSTACSEPLTPQVTVGEDVLLVGGGLTYHPDGGYWQLNWKLDKAWSGCRVLVLQLAGDLGSATFRVS